MALMSLLSGYDNPGEKTGKKTGKAQERSQPQIQRFVAEKI
jgi:hypothetical protein